MPSRLPSFGKSAVVCRDVCRVSAFNICYTLTFSELRHLTSVVFWCFPNFGKALSILRFSFYIYLIYESALPRRVDEPIGTLLQSAAPRNHTNLFKSSKSFFHRIYLFDLFRFVRFLSAGHSLSRLRRDELMSLQANKFSKSFQIFFSSIFICSICSDVSRLSGARHLLRAAPPMKRQG